MDLLEHQGKALFAEAGIVVARSWLATSAPEAARLGASHLPLAVKAQVLTGGRGKAGGVRLVRTPPELTTTAADILGMTIKGSRVQSVLLEEAVDIDRELYLAVMVSRYDRRPLLLFSARGGMDIEQVAREEPAAVVRLPIDPVDGLTDEQIAAAVDGARLWETPVGDVTRRAPRAVAGGSTAVRLADTVRAVWRLFRSADATLIEINPLVITVAGDVLALDAKVTVDDNALYRQPELTSLRDPGDERERRAREAGLTYVSLDGDVGVLGNGAGLVMSTLDLIAAAGGRAANFCDVGGGARAEAIAAAFEIVSTDDRVRSMLVSIFGGITRGDEVAAGLLTALGRRPTTLPVVVRLDGNGAAAGREALTAAALLDLTVAATVDEAVAAAVAAVGGGTSAFGRSSAADRPARE